MSRTYDVTLPIVAYTQTYSFRPLSAGITATYTLSAETMLATPPLSGDDKYCKFLLYAELGTHANRTTLSATQVVLNYTSIFGAQSAIGRVDSSTYSGNTSAFTAGLKFDNLNFHNTTINLSGQSVTSVIESTTLVDNPMYITDFVVTDSTADNLQFKTVGNHVRLAALNG